MASKKFRLVISPLAEQDIDSIIEYYESQKEGLGERFYRNFMGILSFILQHPFMYAKIVLHFRSAIISPFSYSLYYSVNEEDKTISVVAVIHHARSKRFIHRRLKM